MFASHYEVEQRAADKNTDLYLSPRLRSGLVHRHLAKGATRLAASGRVSPSEETHSEHPHYPGLACQGQERQRT